jgi:hypothetical protein
VCVCACVCVCVLTLCGNPRAHQDDLADDADGGSSAGAAPTAAANGGRQKQSSVAGGIGEVDDGALKCRITEFFPKDSKMVYKIQCETTLKSFKKRSFEVLRKCVLLALLANCMVIPWCVTCCWPTGGAIVSLAVGQLHGDVMHYVSLAVASLACWPTGDAVNHST